MRVEPRPMYTNESGFRRVSDQLDRFDQALERAAELRTERAITQMASTGEAASCSDATHL